MSYNEYIWLAMIKMMKFVIKNDKNDEICNKKMI